MSLWLTEEFPKREYLDFARHNELVQPGYTHRAGLEYSKLFQDSFTFSMTKHLHQIVCAYMAK